MNQTASIEGYYDRAYWLDGAWAADWVAQLPASYWQRVVDAIATNYVSWLPPGEVKSWLATPQGRVAVSDILFVRLSQASATFVPWLEETRPLAGMRLLEIGCGSGSSTAALTRAGAYVRGFDIAAPYIAISQERLAALGLAADLRLVPADWLASEASARAEIAVPAGEPPFDLIVCYALIEHLLPVERLNMLHACAALMREYPQTQLVIYETPNRFAPFDWHSTRIFFPDVVPDDLAEAYLRKRLPEGHSWRNNLGSLQTASGRLNWFRGGRGASFHEFDIAMGLENIEIVNDGYSARSAHIDNYRSFRPYEEALATVFASMKPPVPRGFCRPTLDLRLRWIGN